MSHSEADITRVIAGHKAAIARDGVSDEAKQHSMKEIESLQREHPEHRTEDTSETGVNSHVVGGLKATISNDRTSDEAKANAQARLEEMGIDAYGETGAPVANDDVIEREANDEHTNRQLGGYKATLSNPTVSKEAKEHAAEVLREAGVQP